MSTPPEQEPDPGLVDVLLAGLIEAAQATAPDDPDDDQPDAAPDPGDDQDEPAADDFAAWLAHRLAVDVETYLEQQR